MFRETFGENAPDSYSKSQTRQEYANLEDTAFNIDLYSICTKIEITIGF